MSVGSNPSLPTIPDYVPPVAAERNSDNEIIEGPSRVSLKCPISFSRIKIPVKGHSCKHLQCFDYDNYVEINSRRPLWRCPHCSQSVCFQDIRIDQSMVKVLKEVGEDVSYVKISGDDSWEAITETIISNRHTDNPNDVPYSNQETTSQNVDDIMDSTDNDNQMDHIDKDDGKQPLPAGVSRLSSVMNNNIAPHMKESYWRDLCLYALGSRPSTNTISGVNDAVQRDGLKVNSLTQGRSQSPTTVSNNMHSQQKENSNNNNNNYNGHDTSQSLTSPQVGARAASPKQISGSRHTSPFSADRFNSSQHQSLNQRTQHPVRPSGQPSQVYSSAAIQRATSQNNMSQSPSILPPVQTSGLVATTADQRGSSVEESADENLRPTGRMRGSLSGWQYTEALKNQSIIQPSQPVQPARPPPVLNTPRPFIPPHLQALMANNPRPQAGFNGPGSDSRMAGSDN